MSSINALRARVESSLAGRIAAPFAYRDRRVVDTASSGIPEIERLAGGLPRGGLTEICGPPCSGRTSLLLSALAARTAQAEVCALVDGRDGFDPQAAEAAGVRLEQLLWVRCRDIEQSLRATDLLVRGGGFGLIAVDLADIDPKTVRGVTLNTWFRFRRAVEDTPSILLLLEQESNAKTCASLVLRLEAEPVEWLSQCRPPGRETGINSGRRYEKHDSTDAAAQVRHTEMELSRTCLLGGFGVRAEKLQARVQPMKEISFSGALPKKSDGANERVAIFETRIELSGRAALRASG
jgi:recombination protein RecA